MTHRSSILYVAPFAAIALLLAWFPAAGAWCQYDRAAIAAGQVHRLLLCHLAHWSTTHLFWDLATFVVLGLLAARLSPTRFLWCTGLSAAAISLAVALLLPTMPTYRGLSGIDSALFVLLVMHFLTRTLAQGRCGATTALLSLLAAFSAKTAFEFLTGRTLFVQDLGAAVTCVPLAHVAGAIVGAAVGCCGLSGSKPSNHGEKSHRGHFRPRLRSPFPTLLHLPT